MHALRGLLIEARNALAAEAPHLSKDDAAALTLLVASMYDTLAARNEAARTCPGPYWRTDADGARRRVCSVEAPSFSRNALGPARQDGPRSICNACTQLWARDTKKKRKIATAQEPPE